jgi:hypothetical protein
VETGGLILGTLPDQADEPIGITGFYPVEIEHRFGPGFRLSERDFQTFLEAAEEAQEDGDQQVIGYYRSNLRGSSEVREEDRTLISLLWPSGESLVGLVVADAQTPSVMELFEVRPEAQPR